jgi:hypothetical protein
MGSVTGIPGTATGIGYRICRFRARQKQGAKKLTVNNESLERKRVAEDQKAYTRAAKNRPPEKTDPKNLSRTGPISNI